MGGTTLDFGESERCNQKIFLWSLLAINRWMSLFAPNTTEGNTWLLSAVVRHLDWKTSRKWALVDRVFCPMIWFNHSPWKRYGDYLHIFSLWTKLTKEYLTPNSSASPLLPAPLWHPVSAVFLWKRSKSNKCQPNELYQEIKGYPPFYKTRKWIFLDYRKWFLVFVFWTRASFQSLLFAKRLPINNEPNHENIFFGLALPNFQSPLDHHHFGYLTQDFRCH